MNLTWMQQADPISSFQKRVVEVLCIARSGFQPDDDLLGSGLEWPQMGKEPLKACCIVAELTGFDHLTFLHRQATHHTRLHANIDTYRIRQCGWGRHRRGRFRHRFCPPSSHKREDLPIASTGKPSNQDERALIVDRQSCQLAPQAATSLIVAYNPDGRGAVCSRWSLSLPRGHTLQPRLSRCFHQSSTPVPFGGEVCYLPNSI
jgi:hypothetical protein